MNLRMDRVERLLDELSYEVSRGMMESEVEEQLSFVFYVPISKSIPDGVVYCEFRTRPMLRNMMPFDVPPKLQALTGGKK